MSNRPFHTATSAIRGGYDAVSSGASKRRRAPQIERSQEGLGNHRKALKAMNISRDLLRNFTAARSLDHQKRVNVIGQGPKLMLHFDDKDKAEEVSSEFNEVYQKDCDSRNNLHFADLLGQVLSGIGTDGGCIMAFDNFDRNDGRLLFWNLDQLVKVHEDDWQNRKHPWKEGRGKNAKPMQQDKGIIRDKRGRVEGYIVHPQPGKQIARMDEVTILPTKTARMVARPWRLNQAWPVPEYLPMAADLSDLYDMRASELQTAKKMAKLYGWVKSEATEEERDLMNDRAPVGSEEADDATDTTETSITKDNYEALEELTGGYTDYLDEDDDVEIHDPTRPNEQVIEFFNHCLFGAAASIGLAQVHANLEAKNNFTAFRGEMLMSWGTFRVDQKFLERQVCDWVAEKWINRQLQRNKITGMPDGWDRRIAWQWPRMPILDPSKEYKALIDAVKAGAINMEEILGPDWERKLDKLATQLDHAREKDIPLGVFETAAGAPTNK